MINERSLRAIDGLRDGPDYVRPYEGVYSFATIPSMVRQAFGDRRVASGLVTQLIGPLAGEFDRVVLCLVDGFGWRFLEQFEGRYPFLHRLVTEGYVTKLEAQFPSTTTAHVTTLHSDMPVAEHGLYEWLSYDPTVDRIICPLRFSYAGDDEEAGNLLAGGIQPEAVLPRGRHYTALAELGVSSRLFQSRVFTPSPYMHVAGSDVEAIPTDGPADGARQLAEAVLAERGRGFFFLYAGELDSAAHRHGIGSPQFVTAADEVMSALEALHGQLAGKAASTLLLVTADHGLVESRIDRLVRLEEAAPELGDWMRRSRDGWRLAPAGSGRDLFLHVEDAHLEAAVALLADRLAGVAEVRPTRDLISEGYFRGEASARFRSGMADLAVLPRRLDLVWWNEGGRFRKIPGHHGGLSPEEMEIPLLASAY
ncbi:MAG TPA: alkaline phosphatase family protein [Candidatus Dormibacteraeota bacterium]|nr:alkaline phosphatase family protein [Candidatus Dormibacteraeota bacterium]